MRWRVLGLVVLVLAVVGAAQGQTSPATSIRVTTKNPPVDGLVWTMYGTPARITGRAASGKSGQPVELQWTVFPFGPFRTIQRTTTTARGAYSFKVKPKLATRYRVVPVGQPGAASLVVTVYVAARSIVSDPPCRNGPVCMLHVGADVVYPPKVVAQESAKKVFFYLGVRYGSSKGQVDSVYLTKSGRQRSIASSRYRARFTARFQTPGPYHYNWIVCTKSTESVDGFGLPGHHSCGDTLIPYPAYARYTG